jgi:hypothetical protein
MLGLGSQLVQSDMRQIFDKDMRVLLLMRQ